MNSRGGDGPMKNESLSKFYLSLGISHNLVTGLGVSDFASVGHIYAFLIKSLKFSMSVSDFKMPVSASLGFTIRHPYQFTDSSILFCAECTYRFC